jgi:hypothetical protein
MPRGAADGLIGATGFVRFSGDVDMEHRIAAIPDAVFPAVNRFAVCRTICGKEDGAAGRTAKSGF